MTDRILIVVSCLMLIAFMAILAINVNEIDLWIVVLMVLGMAMNEFLKSFRSNGTQKPSGD